MDKEEKQNIWRLLTHSDSSYVSIGFEIMKSQGYIKHFDFLFEPLVNIIKLMILLVIMLKLIIA